MTSAAERGGDDAGRRVGIMCRRPPSVEEPAKDEDVSTPRLGLTFGLLIFLDVAVTCGFSLYAPPRGLNPCALRLFFFGSSTVDLVVLCVARSVASLVVARRVGAVSGGAKRIVELRSHASLDLDQKEFETHLITLVSVLRHADALTLFSLLF